MEHIYIHIPFCKRICSYCDFCKIIYDKKYVINYLNALKNEIDQYYEDDIIKTLYIGGGTPSVLQQDELILLFKILNSIRLDDKYEFTFECNVDDIDDNLLTILKNNKVNRLSIGVESFSKNKLLFMNRKCYTFEFVLDKINLCKKYGFDNINIDLMYGIPEETLKELKMDLKLFMKLNVNHISIYSLIIEDNTKIKIDGYKNINEDLEAKMYEMINKYLSKNNYIHYEVSNYSKVGYQSSHNLGYWNNEEYFGFGLGASGYISGLRYTNTLNINNYIKGNYRKEENITSKKNRMDNEIMLGLRKLEGINLNDFYNKYNENLQNIYPAQDLVNKGLLKYKNGFLFIPENNIYIMNEILLKLL